MEHQTFKRSLTTVLAIDVVGYSRLMSRDEAGTLSALKAHWKELLEPKAAQYHGRIVKLMGDGALLQFESVVDAVAFAVEVQCAMRVRNAEVPEERVIRFRIGINIGDIIIEGEDILGDGVNVAVRVEGVADPGGVSLSRNVFNQVRTKFDLTFECVGERKVKNIDDPITIYRVVLDEKAAALATPVAPTAHASGLRRWPVVATAATLSLAAIIAIGWWQPWVSAVRPFGGETVAVKEPAEMSVAVLPFENMSGGPDLDYFSDGMTEDIITELSRTADLAVASRTSSFSYKDEPVKIQQVAQELGVRYVLEGSARKSGQTVRIAAQLIDGQTGHHVWAERFDQSGDNVLELQERIATKIISTLTGNEGQIRQAETARAWAKDVTTLEEYDYYLRGHKVFYNFTKESMARARQIWQEGLEKFPDSGLLTIKVGWTHFQDVVWGWSTAPKDDLARALQLAQKGLADTHLPPIGQWYGHWLMSLMYVWQLGDFDKAAAEADRAFALAPSDTETLVHLSQIWLFQDDLGHAETLIDHSISLEPEMPEWFNQYIGWIRFQRGDYHGAVEAFEKISWPHPQALRLLASSYQRLGLAEEANARVEKLASDYPLMTGSYLRETLPYKDRTLLKELLNDLKSAGLPQ